MADDFNRNHQRGQSGDGTEEVLQVVPGIFLQSDVVVITEGHQGATEGNVDRLCRAHEAGDQADQICQQQEDESFRAWRIE